jgi:hypothetical protein
MGVSPLATIILSHEFVEPGITNPKSKCHSTIHLNSIKIEVESERNSRGSCGRQDWLVT